MTKLTSSKVPWWKAGVRFECQGSGQCCVSHGEYGNVWLTLEDRQRLALALGLKTGAFTRQYCESIKGLFRLKEEKPECVFLKNKKCSVYKARPTQCRTWPFWPEVLSAKTWSKEVASFCPGVGKGKLWTAKNISEMAALQTRSESDLLTEARRKKS